MLDEVPSHIFAPQLLPASNADESHRALVIAPHLKAIVSALRALEVAHGAVPSATSRIDRMLTLYGIIEKGGRTEADAPSCF